MNPDTNTPSRQAALNVLAVIGFVALIGAGMWLAVYSARYVPATIARVGAAAVSLGSIFVPAPAASLSVVPAASSTVITFGDSTTTPATSTPTLPVAASNPVATHPAPSAGARTSTDYQISGTSTPPALSGQADFLTTITNVGYLTSTTTDSFVASTTVPRGSVVAVRFTIKNIGTNVTGSWRFSASIPTATAYIFQSPAQQSLNPGDSIEYTLGFDQALTGTNKSISVSANFDHAVPESNVNNDNASATVTILGS